MVCALVQPQIRLRLSSGRFPKVFPPVYPCQVSAKTYLLFQCRDSRPQDSNLLIKTVFFHTSECQTLYEMWYHKIQVKKKTHLASITVVLLFLVSPIQMIYLGPVKAELLGVALY